MLIDGCCSAGDVDAVGIDSFCVVSLMLLLISLTLLSLSDVSASALTSASASTSAQETDGRRGRPDNGWGGSLGSGRVSPSGDAVASRGEGAQASATTRSEQTNSSSRGAASARAQAPKDVPEKAGGGNLLPPLNLGTVSLNRAQAKNADGKVTQSVTQPDSK